MDETDQDTDGFSYSDWMELLTTAIDHTLAESHVDLNYGDNRLLRNQELDRISTEWERIKFFDQHYPNVDDLTKVIEHFVDRLPEFEHGKRRQFRLALEHEANVKAWLGTTKFNEADYHYILDRERYLAEQFFDSDDKYELYSETDYQSYNQLRLRQLFNRFLRDYPAFYKGYELDSSGKKNPNVGILRQANLAQTATDLNW